MKRFISTLVMIILVSLSTTVFASSNLAVVIADHREISGSVAAVNTIMATVQSKYAQYNVTKVNVDEILKTQEDLDDPLNITKQNILAWAADKNISKVVILKYRTNIRDYYLAYMAPRFTMDTDLIAKVLDVPTKEYTFQGILYNKVNIHEDQPKVYDLAANAIAKMSIEQLMKQLK